jgi:hypothetical protein
MIKENISEMDSWNAKGKHWSQKYDNTFGVDCFLCKCSDIKGLDIINKDIIVFVPCIDYFKYIISQKTIEKSRKKYVNQSRQNVN